MTYLLFIVITNLTCMLFMFTITTDLIDFWWIPLLFEWKMNVTMTCTCYYIEWIHNWLIDAIFRQRSGQIQLSNRISGLSTALWYRSPLWIEARRNIHSQVLHWIHQKIITIITIMFQCGPRANQRTAGPTYGAARGPDCP